MPRSLDPSDFRAVRIVLEPSDFALGDDIPEPPPSDLIDKDTWLSIMTLPDDVAIRTSNYHGTALEKLHDIWGALVETVSVENQDALDAALLDAADDFQGAVFNALCGFYRLSFTSLRSVVELVVTLFYGRVIFAIEDLKMRNLFLAVTMLYFCFGASAQAPSDKPPQCPLKIPLVPPGALGEVDQSFLDSYCAEQLAVYAHQAPYVIVSGSNLILHWGPGRKREPDQEKGIPDTYHALKDIAHVPFSVYLLLTPIEKGFVPLGDQRTALTTLKDRTEAAKSSLDEKYFSSEQIQRQERILESSANLIVKVLNTGQASRDALTTFAAEMGPLMLQNAWDAGCEQIKTTHAQMMAWKRQLTGDEWATLRVVNVARHQARYKNAATQYFHWLFGDNGPAWGYPGESMRVIFAETLGKDGTSIDELTTVEIDADASEAFFKDRWRMSEDILSNGASACVAKLPEKDRIYTKVNN